MKVMDARRVRRQGKDIVRNAVQQFFDDLAEDAKEFEHMMRHLLADDVDDYALVEDIMRHLFADDVDDYELVGDNFDDGM